MKIDEILGVLLPIVYILVGIALVAFLITLIRVLLTTNKTIKDVKTQIDPTLANVEQITTDLLPAAPKVDPLLDRVQLTVDTLNLEMMRVDQILEDVSEITDVASSAVVAVDNVTHAPVKLANNIAPRCAARSVRRMQAMRPASSKSSA